MNAHPIRPFTVANIQGNRSQIFGTPISPYSQSILSDYARVSVPAEKLIKPTKSAECHLSWIHNHSNRATYITSHRNVLFFEKNLLSNFIQKEVLKLYFLIYTLIPSVAEPPNLMPPRSTLLPLDTKYPREDAKLHGSVGHTLGENPKIHILPSGSQMRE